MKKQPNILLLFTDQHRYDAIGASGNPVIRTPVLDSLCEEGTSFSRCYTPSPVCVPARAAMVTGMPPHCTGCWDNGTNIDPSVPSFMEKLTEQGYQTHGVGKMHFTPTRKRMWGFQSRDVSERSDDDYRTYLNDQGYEHVLNVHGALREMYSIPQVSQMPAHLHESAWVADCSIDFLDRRDASKPFFLWSSFFSPHPPFDAPTPWNLIYWAGQMIPPFRPEGYEELLCYWNHLQSRATYRASGYDEMLFRTMKAFYYASISFIDYQIGRILDALGDEKDSTIIVFTSDHGEMLGDYGCFGKRCMFEAAAKVPLIIRWPDGANAGKQCDEPVTLLDIYPTLMTAAQNPNPHVHREGEDLAKVMNAETDREIVFSQLQTENRGLHMAVSRDHKYFYSAADEKEWLFDLKTDPHETHNFAGNSIYIEEWQKLKNALLDRYATDGYDSVLENGDWRKFGKYILPDNPEAYLMVQHPPKIEEILKELGPYAPSKLPESCWPGKIR